jgi:hypothetical protein
MGISAEDFGASMAPYVLLVGATKIAFVVVAYLLVDIAGVSLPSGGGGITLITLLPAIWWFRHRVNRPMTKAERFWFASGSALVDLALSVGVILCVIAMSGRRFNSASVDLAVGAHDTLYDWGIYAVVAITELLTFAAAYFLGWSMTRKLPRTQQS